MIIFALWSIYWYEDVVGYSGIKLRSFAILYFTIIYCIIPVTILNILFCSLKFWIGYIFYLIIQKPRMQNQKSSIRIVNIHSNVIFCTEMILIKHGCQNSEQPYNNLQQKLTTMVTFIRFFRFLKATYLSAFVNSTFL